MKNNEYNSIKIIMIVMLVMIASKLDSQVTVPARAPRIVSPEVHPDQTVTFRIKANNAKNVSLIMNDAGITDPKPFEKDESGLWRITVGPLKPDIYWYNFLVDGVLKVYAVNNELNLLWINCLKEDGLLTSAKSLSDFLDDKGITHTFFQTPGGHSWPVWRSCVNEFLLLLFN